MTDSPPPDAPSPTDVPPTDGTPTDGSPSATPLASLHAELGGRLVDFAGWSLPIQFEGVIAEHLHTRTSASLFDVGHMGVVELRAPDAGERLERLSPAGFATLAPGRQRYGLLTTDDGGVLDDLMVVHHGDHLTAVVNASRTEVDLARLGEVFTADEMRHRTDRCLLALQGPLAVDALRRLAPEVGELTFLDAAVVDVDGVTVGVTRSGYTGEDGFELEVPVDHAEAIARRLLAESEVAPAGLGARDTLRLEAGLHLYGNDLDTTISPIEADLAWTIPRRRREAADFPGADRILGEIADGPVRRRVGLRPEGRRPVRDGAELVHDDRVVGTVTSGGFSPTLDHPIALGLVATELTQPGTTLAARARGRDEAVTVVDLPFVPHRYVRRAS